MYVQQNLNYQIPVYPEIGNPMSLNSGLYLKNILTHYLFFFFSIKQNEKCLLIVYCVYRYSFMHTFQIKLHLNQNYYVKKDI